MEFLVFFSFYERSKNLPLPRTLLSHVKQNFKSPASAKGTLSRPNQWGLLCSKKTFPVEILFFSSPKRFAWDRQKKFKNAGSVFRKPLEDLHCYASVLFFSSFTVSWFAFQSSLPFENFCGRDVFPNRNVLESNQTAGIRFKIVVQIKILSWQAIPKWSSFTKRAIMPTWRVAQRIQTKGDCGWKWRTCFSKQKVWETMMQPRLQICDC